MPYQPLKTFKINSKLTSNSLNMPLLPFEGPYFQGPYEASRVFPEHWFFCPCITLQSVPTGPGCQVKHDSNQMSHLTCYVCSSLVFFQKILALICPICVWRVPSMHTIALFGDFCGNHLGMLALGENQ